MMSETPDRVREVIKAVKSLHVLATVDAEGAPRMRWMGALLEDPDEPWTFYLACRVGSRKLQELEHNPHAQLLFSDMDRWQVASLSGTAAAVDSPELRQLLWDAVPAMQRYYSGVDDPKLGIIRFTTRCMELLAMHEAREPYCFEL